VQIFRSWSPEMVPESDKGLFGLEYSASNTMASGFDDKDLIELAKRELIQIGLATEGDFIDAVSSSEKAYPVYDDD